jgi:dTDP-glucose pyrophosphorylase
LVNENGLVSKVAEKQEISDNATIGVYYWRSSRYFLECAEKFIHKGVTTNGEFYISPVYNEAIDDGKVILAVDSFKHVSLGTPEQLNDYLRHKG